MKKKFFLVLALLICMSSTALAAPNSSIYRYYNRRTGEHLYTDSDEYSEWYNLLYYGGPSGWYREGLAWRAPKIGYGEPVYRLYNSHINDHLYTKDGNEVNTLTRLGWTRDFNGRPAFASGGNVPIYRLYNPHNGRHHLTTDSNEYNTLPRYGWRQEGVSFRALSIGSH